MTDAIESSNPKQLLRNQPGTSFKDCFNWGMLPIEQMDSSFSVQQYIQLLISSKQSVSKIIEMPSNQDIEIWQYEQLRILCLDLNNLVLLLQEECLPKKCNEMKADEWLYLCAAHQTPQTCCAIDYIVHTLDGATSLLNSSKYFPSRVSIPAGSVKHFQSIARRLYRIFAHAWYHHRTVFDTFEEETKLYQRFLALSDVYQLVSSKLIIIPGKSSEKPQTPGDDEMNDV